MDDLKLSDETLRVIESLVGQTLLALRSPQGNESLGWLSATLSTGLLVMAPDDCSVDPDDPKAEYFRLSIETQQQEPQLLHWPGGVPYEWQPLSSTPRNALPAEVLTAVPATGDCDLGRGHTGVELVLGSGFRVLILSEGVGIHPMRLQVAWHRQPLSLVPNNSFNPKRLRRSG